MEKFYKKYHLGLKSFISQKIDDEGVIEEVPKSSGTSSILRILLRRGFFGLLIRL